MRVSIDTRTLKPGDVFIPVKGSNFDGHDFIDDAIRKGASKVLDVDLASFARDYRKGLSLPVIAITGSSGKTTTKDLLAAVLGVRYRVHKTSENQNNEIGVPLTVLGIEHDTEIAVIEMGMRHPGEIAHLCSIALPSHCVITSIGYTHLELLGSIENIALAKSEILSAFPDSPNPRYAYYPEHIRYKDRLSAQAVCNAFEITEVPCASLLDTNINLVRAIARQFGLTEQEISAGLQCYRPSSNRQEVWEVKSITLINDTYNANPDSVVFALRSMADRTGRKIAVLGDMLELGGQAWQLHKDLGEDILRSGVSLVFTIGDLSSAIEPSGVTVYHFQDKQTLAETLLRTIKTGDVVLFKASRGMKLEETFLHVKASLR